MYKTGQIVVNQAGDAVIIGFGPAFEIRNLPLLTEILEEAISHGHTNLVVDMSNITLPKATALFPFLHKWPELRRKGGDVRLCGLSLIVKEALQLLEVENLPDVYDSLEQALKTVPVARANA